MGYRVALIDLETPLLSAKSNVTQLHYVTSKNPPGLPHNTGLQGIFIIMCNLSDLCGVRPLWQGVDREGEPLPEQAWSFYFNLVVSTLPRVLLMRGKKI
jgi:hypothetical protein